MTVPPLRRRAATVAVRPAAPATAPSALCLGTTAMVPALVALLALLALAAAEGGPFNNCASALTKTCLAARASGGFGGCEFCAGSHTQELHDAGCLQPQISSFCNNSAPGPPAPSTQQWQCSHCESNGQCRQLATISPSCEVHNNSQCDGQCPPPPPPPPPGPVTPECNSALTICLAARAAGGFGACEDCTGSHASTLQAAGCLQPQIVSFCNDTDCCGVRSAVLQAVLERERPLAIQRELEQRRTGGQAHGRRQAR